MGRVRCGQRKGESRGGMGPSGDRGPRVHSGCPRWRQGDQSDKTQGGRTDEDRDQAVRQTGWSGPWRH